MGSQERELEGGTVVVDRIEQLLQAIYVDFPFSLSWSRTGVLHCRLRAQKRSHRRNHLTWTTESVSGSASSTSVPNRPTPWLLQRTITPLIVLYAVYC
jgi:hypothetical protein